MSNLVMQSVRHVFNALSSLHCERHPVPVVPFPLSSVAQSLKHSPNDACPLTMLQRATKTTAIETIVRNLSADIFDVVVFV